MDLPSNLSVLPTPARSLLLDLGIKTVFTCSLMAESFFLLRCFQRPVGRIRWLDQSGCIFRGDSARVVQGLGGQRVVNGGVDLYGLDNRIQAGMGVVNGRVVVLFVEVFLTDTGIGKSQFQSART